jgi:hypothetical protein
MQSPVFSAQRFRTFTHRSFDLTAHLFDNRVFETGRSLLLSSLLWLLLAAFVYMVYTLIVNH